MAAAIEYSKAWPATVTQQTDITVLGEDFSPEAVQADKLITVKVSEAELKQCLGYESNWVPLTTDQEGEQPLPDVVLRLAAAVGAKLDRVHVDLRSKTGAAANSRTFKDDVDADISSFARIFLQEVTFTNSVFDTSIPKAAIRAIDEQQAVALPISEIIGNISTVGQASNNVVVALHSLFEQAVAANRVKHADAGAVDITGVDGFKSAVFQNGDSLTVYIDYSFIKTRSYTVDNDVSAIDGNVKAAIVSLSINGQTFSINTASTELSNTHTVRYGIKLLADAAPSKWDA
jgi:hypothetical protein